jgi:hypothetical protein
LALIFCVALPPITLAQESSTIPINIETTLGWNQFTFSGINDDMRAIRDSMNYSHFDIPIGNFGKDFNFGMSVSTDITNDVSAGISIQYCMTRGYYRYDGTTLTSQIATEQEYALSRIVPQVAVEYSHRMHTAAPITVSARGLIGVTFVDLRKDFNFAFAPQSPNPPFPFLPPFVLHVTGQYQVINPELGAQVSLSVGIFSNIRFKASIAIVYSPSKEVSGEFDSVTLQEILTEESFKNVLLRNVNLGYYGATIGGGLEFGQ